MERATGIGGLFFRSDDPVALSRWYREALGIDTFSEGGEDGVWSQEAGPTVWAPFPRDTSYFGGSGQTWMVNLRVRDLEAMLAQLRANGVTVHDDVQVMPGIGRFGWADDPDGNRFELWEPEAAASSLDAPTPTEPGPRP